MTALKAQPEEKGEHCEEAHLERPGPYAAWAAGWVGGGRYIQRQDSCMVQGPVCTEHVTVGVLLFVGQVSHIPGSPGLPHGMTLLIHV